MGADERDVHVGDRTLRVREAGEPTGQAVVYFHGTPGSRLDLVFGDDIARESAVRLVTFDRPGYGGSTARRFGLSDVALDAVAIADALGIDHFATLGLSGGGPFALATAAVAPTRVTAVGVAAGAGPFQHVPGALDSLSESDTAAVRLLAEDVSGAADGFAAGFEELAALLQDGTHEDLVSHFEGAMSARDKELFLDPRFGALEVASMREGLSAGLTGAAWDNVAWIGEWDFDLAEVACPWSFGTATRTGWHRRLTASGSVITCETPS